LDILCCSKITSGRGLGYKKITLVRVPLYLQFKLLFKDIFDCVVSDTHPEETDEPKVITHHIENESNEVNFILSDTYQIHLGDLPDQKRNYLQFLLSVPQVFREVEPRTQNLYLLPGSKRINTGYSILEKVFLII
jgi:hypothetical protein